MSREATEVREVSSNYELTPAKPRVPEGYTQTDVGVIPEEWKVFRLDEHFLIYAGGDVPKDSLSSIRSEKHPFPIFANAIQNKGLYGFTNRQRSKPDSLTITARGFLGHAEYRGEPFFPIVRLLVLEPKGTLDSKFATYAINDRVTFPIESTGVPQLTAPQVGRYAIGAPTEINEQQAIAVALSDVDALLEELDRLIAKKRDIKQATMQQLLTGQTRLGEFGRLKGRKNTEVGEFPVDWSISALSELVESTRGIRYGIVQPGKYDATGRYMIRGQDYSESRGWANPSDVFRVSDAVEKNYKNARVKRGDLIMTIVGYCGHVEMVPAWLDGANLTQTTARIAIDPTKANPLFCKYFLQSDVGKRQVASYLKGAAQPGLNCTDVERFLVALPPRQEQEAISGLLADLDEDIEALQRRRAKAADIKQAMMQELLTGRTRLL